ncbi:acyl-CoA reductase [Bacterioplanoides sp.]|uniref:acyl-CoA reductase n=1 Tax=Bacterioplanoides sp. TaxID=2066072 RepID=UPI003B00133E
MLYIDEMLSTPDKPLIQCVDGVTVKVGDPLRLGFLSEVSRTVLKSKKAKAYPDLITFAYYCRERSIKSKLDSFPFVADKRGWGAVVHIAPANVPINFAFSFLFGFLSGNSNIVRLPSKRWPQVELLLDIISDVVKKPDYQGLSNSFRFIRTEHDSQWLVDAIRDCDGLIVWGGDSTVSQFKALAKKPRCIEMYFPNRVSSLIVHANSVLQADSAALARYVDSFYNDTYIVDQNACSSPSKVLWVGEREEVEEARKLFWECIGNKLNEKEYALDPVARIDRYLDVMENVAARNTVVSLSQWSTDLWTEEDGAHTGNYRFGNFHEFVAGDINDAIGYLDKDEQTLTYIGFSPYMILEAFQGTGKLVDRIVPVGRALEMQFSWDGVNLLERFSRSVELV